MTNLKGPQQETPIVDSLGEFHQAQQAPTTPAATSVSTTWGFSSLDLLVPRSVSRSAPIRWIFHPDAGLSSVDVVHISVSSQMNVILI